MNEILSKKTVEKIKKIMYQRYDMKLLYELFDKAQKDINKILNYEM